MSAATSATSPLDNVMRALQEAQEAAALERDSKEAELVDRLKRAEAATAAAMEALRTFEAQRRVEVIEAARVALLAEIASANPAVAAVLDGSVTLPPPVEPVDPCYVQDPVGVRLALALRSPDRYPLVLITGPSGSGKTFPAENELRAQGRRYVRIACHQGTTARSLLQRTRAEDGSTIEADGPVTVAARAGWAVLIDEYDKADPREIACLQPLFTGDAIILDDGQEVAPAAGFQVIATGNGLVDESGLYSVARTSTDLPNRAFLIRAQYPDEAVEVEAYKRATGCREDLAKQARRGVAALRGLADKGQLEAAPSIRTGIRYLFALSDGLKSPDAWRSAILDGLRPSQAKAGQDAIALAKAW